jgi:hypothetical protein
MLKMPEGTKVFEVGHRVGLAGVTLFEHSGQVAADHQK